MVTLGEFNDRHGKLLSEVERLLDSQEFKRLKEFKKGTFKIRTVKRGHFLQEGDALRHPEIASLLGLPKDYEELSITDLQSDTVALKEDIHQLFVDLGIADQSPWKREGEAEGPEGQAEGPLVKKDERYFGDLKLCQQSLRMLDQLVFMKIKSLKDKEHYTLNPQPISEVTSLDGLFCLGDPKLGYYAKSFSIDTKFGREDMIHVIQADNTELFSFWQKNAELDGEDRKAIVSSFFHVASMIGSTAMLDLVRKEVEDINVPDESGNTALVNTFNLPYMEMMNTRSVFNESNFDYLIEQGADKAELLQTAMMFTTFGPNGGEKYKKIFEKLIDAGVDPVLEDGVTITDWAVRQGVDQSVIDVVRDVIASRQSGPSVSP
ncbi:MAG: hypothetical protein VX737_02440 [Pseudomonadota bacterium]|nr:hypothetical protein [Pseudomonadota bacterium]